MKISIFGLGYVGCVSLGCLAQNGNNVIGVDVSDAKVDLINQGKPTIVEKEIDLIIKKQFSENKIIATKDFIKAVNDSEVSIICVGTPSTMEGHLDLSNIFDCASQIGEALKSKDKFHVIAIRSTVLPGTNYKVGKEIEKISSKKRNIDFAVVSNPEFLREGSAVADYYNPPYTIIGSDNDAAIKIVMKIFSTINAPFKIVDIKVAELIKYVNNSFHALKITFANEVGNICKKLGIDSHELLDVFCADHHLNISSAYLKPGFAYGGSCLFKDLKGLNAFAYDCHLDVPVLKSIELSNNYQKQLVIDLILNFGFKKIGVIGISFKADTDDLRYSPSVEIMEYLIGKGKEIQVYDKNVHISRLIGKNKSYIMEKLPHISSLMTENLNDLITNNQIIIITNKCEDIKNVNIPADKIVLDLQRIDHLESHPNYYGLSW